MFHISLRSNLEGVWVPRLPDGDQAGGEFGEPLIPRICLAPSIEQCFYAIYMNISKFFEVDNIPYINMSIYRPMSFKGLVTNDTIVGDRLVHDAHITGECFLTEPNEMKFITQISIKNPTSNKEIWYNPYNDNSLPSRFLSYSLGN